MRVCVTFYVVAAHPGTSAAQRIAHRSDSAACTCRRVHVAGRCTHITFGMNNECRCVSDATRSHARNPKPTTHQHHRRPESRATWRVTAYRRCTHTAHVWRTHMTEHYIIRPKHTHIFLATMQTLHYYAIQTIPALCAYFNDCFERNLPAIFGEEPQQQHKK